MKMTKTRYSLLKAAMRAVAEYYGPAVLIEYAEARNEKQMIWLLHLKATDQLQYDDTHPFFVNGTWQRIYPHQPGFKMYTDDNGASLNDTHIGTAIFRIGRELGLLKRKEVANGHA